MLAVQCVVDRLESRCRLVARLAGYPRHRRAHVPFLETRCLLTLHLCLFLLCLLQRRLATSTTRTIKTILGNGIANGNTPGRRLLSMVGMARDGNRTDKDKMTDVMGKTRSSWLASASYT